MQSKINLFLKISKFNGLESEFVNITLIKELKLGNGGSWCRFDGKIGIYKVVTVKGNKTYRYSWGLTKKEKIRIDNDIIKLDFDFPIKKNSIIYVKIYGLNDEFFINKTIRKDIIKFYIDKPCVSCGTFSNIEIDHKNGLYNDKRVMTLETQTINDFQPLCKHCNCVKREFVKKSKLNGFWIPPPPPFMKFYKKEKFGDSMENIYWYDPIKFTELFLQNIQENK